MICKQSCCSHSSQIPGKQETARQTTQQHVKNNLNSCHIKGRPPAYPLWFKTIEQVLNQMWTAFLTDQHQASQIPSAQVQCHLLWFSPSLSACVSQILQPCVRLRTKQLSEQQNICEFHKLARGLVRNQSRNVMWWKEQITTYPTTLSLSRSAASRSKFVTFLLRTHFTRDFCLLSVFSSAM